MSLQQALAARYLSQMASVLELPEKQLAWNKEFEELRGLINGLLWNDAAGIYLDLTRSGAQSRSQHIGAFWALLSDVADDAQVKKLVATLRDPDRFYRPHLFPALAANHPDYSPRGHYWRGGVWAPTNYMVVSGLRHRGERGLAREAAENHLDRLYAVYANAPKDVEKINPEDRDGEYQTLWEAYSPETDAPATRWDDQFLTRQDFVGWTGVGPIAMLIEDVLGLELNAPASLISWNLTRTDRHGIENLSLGKDNVVSLVADRRDDPDAPVHITATALKPFTLEVRVNGRVPRVFSACPGESSWVIE
jgi:hypothetical protein